MYEEIIKNFIEKIKKKYSKYNIEIIGILGFGSRFNNESLGKNSDLDLYILIKDIGKRFRGCMILNDIEIDYFINPLRRLELDWENFKKNEFFPETIAYMLRDGKIIFDTNDNLNKIVKEAHVFLKNKLSSFEFNQKNILMSKYFINDFIKDIEDALQKNDIFSWQQNVNLLLKYLLDVFCKFNKISLVRKKYKREDFINCDKKFIEIYESIFISGDIFKETKAIKELSAYIIGKMGGDLDKEWILDYDI